MTTAIPQPLTIPLVQLESPFAGKTAQAAKDNILYGRAALRDMLLRGEAPFASHLLYAQPFVLDDNDPAERRLGMEAGFAFLAVVDYVAVYTDRGISPGMEAGIARAQARGLQIHHRSLPDWARS